MYPVSETYLAAVAADTRESRVVGAITLLDDTVIDITDEDIVQGSLYMSEQCVSGEDLDVGSVYAAEMGLSLTVPLDDPYALEGARIALQYGILTSEPGDEESDWDEYWEYVPLGVFYATEITREKAVVKVKALDGMIRLDVDIEGVVTVGTPAAVFASIALRTGMTLAGLPELPNADVVFTVPADDKIKTCRDILMWVCQATGTFARMGRDGALEVVLYDMAEALRTVAPADRYPTAKVSDNKVKVTQVSMEIDGVIHASGTPGMTMMLSENPLMAGREDIEGMLAEILAAVTDIEYVPFDAELVGDPSLQPGDCIALTDTGSLYGDVTTIITHSTWRYRGRHVLRGAGRSALTRNQYGQMQKAIAAVTATVNAVRTLATDAEAAAALLNTAMGGHVLKRQGEILVMDTTNPETATKIWRWNLNGLGYSDNVTGADNPERTYKVAMTMDGAIDASFITSGVISSDVVFAGELFGARGTFTYLIAGILGAQRMELSSDGNSDPFIRVYDNSNALRVTITKNGVVFGEDAARHFKYEIGSRTGVGTFVT